MAVNLSITTDQLDFIKSLFVSKTWEEIAELYNKKYKANKSADALRILYSRHKDKDLSGNKFADFRRDSFKNTTNLGASQAKYFVTGLMPEHVIDGETVGKVNAKSLATLDSGDLEPIFLAMTGHMKLGQKQPGNYDPIMTGYRSAIHTDVTFNQNLRAVDLKKNPQLLRPLTGVDSYARRQSVIVAHPRQHKEFVATGNSSHPHSMESTGVINFPGYQDNNIGRVARDRHVQGGIVVEIDGPRFFTRKVRFDAKGGYYDLDGYTLKGKTVRGHRIEALVIGDLHVGHHCPMLMRALYEIIAVLRPRRIFFHDAFDGLSVSPHLTDYDRARRASWAESILSEAALNREVMREVRKHAPSDCELVWVESNHNNFLQRWLKSGAYMKDPVNFAIAHQLMLDMFADKNPLERLINGEGHLATLLGPNDDYFVAGWQCANHGHRGVNGTKGSRATLKKSAVKSITGHTHTDFSEDDLEGVGCWTKLDHGYNVGSSTWIRTLAVIQPDGSVQKITPIERDGGLQWRI